VLSIALVLAGTMLVKPVEKENLGSIAPGD